MQKQINTLLFDLDDTIILESKTARKSIIKNITLAGLGIDTTDFFRTIHQQARELWYKMSTIDYCLKIGISSLEALWADFTGDDPELAQLRDLSPDYRYQTWYRTLLRYNIDDQVIALKLSTEYKEIRNSEHVLYPDTISVLTKLKAAYKLGLITNGTPDLQWKKIHGGNLEHFFEYIAISGEHGFAKPDTRLFEIILNKISSDPSGSLMIGNNMRTDIKGAQQAGLKTIWIHRDGEGVIDIDTTPEFTITSLTEINKTLKKVN
jgi:putative hydrolase of the HAD superfamily